MSKLDALWDHFLDVAQYARAQPDRITDARMSIEAAIRADLVDPKRIAAALVDTDDDTQDLLDDGEVLGPSFQEAVMPRAYAMAKLLVVAALNAEHAGQITNAQLRQEARPIRVSPPPNSEAGDYIEDDPAAWEAFVESLRRYHDHLNALRGHEDLSSGAYEIVAGAMLGYLADQHGVFIRREPAGASAGAVE